MRELLRTAARRCAPLLLSALVALVVSLAFRSYGTPVAPPHRMALGGLDPYAWQSNSRDMGQFWALDPLLGIKGDCVTDDTDAIIAAEARRAAHGPGTVLRFPPPPGGCYLVFGELSVASANWRGDAGQRDAGTSTGVVIRAGAPMRSVLHVHNSTADNQANPGYFQDLTIDANGLADYAVDRAGDFKSIYTRVKAYNAKLDAWHADGFRFPLVLSGVTKGGAGSSPAGVTISQPDRGYNGIITAGATNIVLLVNAGGALDTANYVISYDGGSTFTPNTFLISHLVNVPFVSGATVQFSTGIQASFPAGTYVVGDTYSFSATVQVEGSTQYAINADAQLNECWGKYSGSVYTSAAIASFFSTEVPTINTGAGTAAETTFSPIVVGTGTTWMSSGARSGDMLLLKCGANPPFRMPIAVVVDDTHIQTPGLNAHPSLSGCDWALSVGAGFWEDDGSENTRNRYNEGWTEVVPVGTRTTGDSGGGPTLTQLRTTTYAVAAHVVGGLQATSKTTAFHDPHIEAGASIALSGFYLMPKCLGGIIDNAKENAAFEGSGDLQILYQGRYSCQNGNFGSMVPQISDIGLTIDYGDISSNPVVATPNTRLPDIGNYSLVFVTASSDHTWTGAVIQRPSGDAAGTGVNGIKVSLLNYGTHAITIPDQSGGTGSALHLRQQHPVTLHQYEALHVVSRNDFWQEDDPALPPQVAPSIARVTHASTPYQIVYPATTVFADVSGGVIEVDAPASPWDGEQFTVTNTAGSAATNNITVKSLGGAPMQDPNDITITPSSFSAVMSTKGASATWIYDNILGTWWLQ